MKVQSVEITHPFMLLFVPEGLAMEGLTCVFAMALYLPASTAERIRMKFDIGDSLNFVDA